MRRLAIALALLAAAVLAGCNSGGEVQVSQRRLMREVVMFDRLPPEIKELPSPF